MKRWAMFSLVILASLITGIGYYYYNYIYVSPNELKEMAIGADTMAYNELMEKTGARLSEGEFTYRVVVNPAGGGDDKGNTAGDLTESMTALKVAKYMVELNTDPELGIFLTRDTDTNPNRDQRDNIVTTVNPNMVIDIHVSAADDENVMGTTVYYDDGYYDYHLTNSKLSDIMEKATVTQIEGVAAGIYPSDDEAYTFIHGRKIPAVAISCGYITNVKEAEALKSDAYLRNMAAGILNGIEEVKSGKTD